MVLYSSTASKMGACLGQETAHKAALDSFLGNHDEVCIIHLCHYILWLKYMHMFQAIQELVVAVRSKPSPQMFMLLGRTCQNAGDHSQAISAFNRAIEAIVSNNHDIPLHYAIPYTRYIW